ncbi:hypothetical protein SAMN05421819_3549 [Bryocella elongata]|uniref:Uncharacterized protein n=1 Tax=Bryocella elongata TaxID=863522 RepID=A0A1H6B6K5_9BACT|nr:hypothetical protein [Bryocella elongata]SEG56164.1 hypothetical protein SAMN05421819_3549 [Bryocella elongata]
MAETLAELRSTVARMRRQVDKHDVDLYQGSGKDDPSLTTRMALVEDCVGKIRSHLSRIVWLLVAALITGTVDVIVHATRH